MTEWGRFLGYALAFGWFCLSLVQLSHAETGGARVVLGLNVLIAFVALLAAAGRRQT